MYKLFDGDYHRGKEDFLNNLLFKKLKDKLAYAIEAVINDFNPNDLKLDISISTKEDEEGWDDDTVVELTEEEAHKISKIIKTDDIAYFHWIGEVKCLMCGKVHSQEVSNRFCRECQAEYEDFNEIIEYNIPDYERDVWIKKDRNEAIKKARSLIQGNFAILDLETTGLSSTTDKIVQIAIINGQTGATLLNTLVNPKRPISQDASEVNGIYDADVQNAPVFRDIHQQVKQILNENKIFAIYNKDFDVGFLHSEGVFLKNNDFTCIMKLYAEFFGEWHSYWKSYTWQGLQCAIEQCSIDFKNFHNALDDCIATRKLIFYIAESSFGNYQKPDKCFKCNQASANLLEKNYYFCDSCYKKWQELGLMEDI